MPRQSAAKLELLLGLRSASAQPGGSALVVPLLRSDSSEVSLVAQSLEPTLIPKVRVKLAEFPYLLSSIELEASHLRNLMRILVRTHLRASLPLDFPGQT